MLTGRISTPVDKEGALWESEKGIRVMEYGEILHLLFG